MSYRGVYTIIGPPGTGKTHRVRLSVEKICNEYEGPPDGLPAAVCSLTKAAAAEAAGRIGILPDHAIGTLHSFAFRALGCPNLTEAHIADWNQRCVDSGNPSLRLTGRPNRSLDDPLDDTQDDGGAREGEDLSMTYHMVRAQGKDPRRYAMTVQQKRFVHFWEAWKAERQLLDFTDLIEEAQSTYSMPGQPDVILADEAQDLSRLELRLLMHWARSAKALILVGDPWQALYEWRGADPSIFTAHDEEVTARDVLGQSYRVPRAVHGAATSLVKANLRSYTPIRYDPVDSDGHVEQIMATYQDPCRALAIAQECVDRDESIMFMASCGYMVDPICLALKKAGLSYCNPWRRKNGRWNPMGGGRGFTARDRVAAFLVPLTGRPFRAWASSFEFGANAPEERRVWLIEELALVVDILETKRCLLPKAKTRIKGLAETAPGDVAPAELLDAVFQPVARGVIRRLKEMTVEAACEWLLANVLERKRRGLTFPIEIVRKQGPLALFQRPKVYVGTIHSFKGAEADNVVVFPDLSRRGMNEWLSGNTDPIIRMFYVACTRAKQSLYIGQPVGGLAIALGKAITGGRIIAE
jgi:DNA helicase-2/ATP-dependent DNA helicase PcrA